MTRSKHSLDLGTISYYCSTDDFNQSAAWNIVRMCPRKQNGSCDQDSINLKEVTTDDVILWFDRSTEDFFRTASQPNVKYELSPEFDPRYPQAYQYSRVQVADDGRYLENTRQGLCMFCQWPYFVSLTGAIGLLMHIECLHPHEILLFVKCVIDELDVSFKPRKHSKGRADPSLLARRQNCWPTLNYRADGKTNHLRFAPRPGTTNHNVKLAEISENLLVPWYHRDINDYQRYQHDNVRYKLNPFFDPHNPEVAQISRVMIREDGTEFRPSQEFMCLYCERPLFRYPYGELGHLSHIVGTHWPIEFPRIEAVRQTIGP